MYSSLGVAYLAWFSHIGMHACTKARRIITCSSLKEVLLIYPDASISDSASVFSKSTPEYMCVKCGTLIFVRSESKEILNYFPMFSEMTKAHLSVTHDRISVLCMHKLHG